MSLLNRVIDFQLLDLNIVNQLSDISYGVSKGIRQKNREFAQGIQDLGKINFNETDDKITKEMILDYQEEERTPKPAYVDPLTGESLAYYPSIYKLDDSMLEEYKPIEMGVSYGAKTEHRVATEEDIIKKENEYKEIIKEYEMKKDEIIKLKDDIDIIEHEGEAVRLTLDEFRKELAILESKKETYNKNLKDTEILRDKVVLSLKENTEKVDELEASAPTIKAELKANPTDPTLHIRNNNYKILHEETKARNLELSNRIIGYNMTLGDINDSIKEIDDKLVKINKEIVKLEGDGRDIGLALADLKNTLKTYPEKPMKELLEKAEKIKGSIELYKQNIEENKKAADIVKSNNKKYINLYSEGLTIANRNKLKLSKNPDETDEDYYKRIKDIEDEKFDTALYSDKADLSNIRKLKAKLKFIVRDPVIIDNLIKRFTSELIFKINKYFPIIKTKFLNVFGFNNKSLTDSDIYDEFINIVELIESSPDSFEILKESSPPLLTVAASSVLRSVPHADGSDSSFYFDIDEERLYILNSDNSKVLYLKIIEETPSKKVIMASISSGEAGTYEKVNFENTAGKTNTWQYYVGPSHLNLLSDTNKDIYNKYFSGLKTNDIFSSLKKMGLVPLDATKYKKIKVKTEKKGISFKYGAGLKKNEELPEHAKFGNNIILLNKLYHKNILSFKNKSLNAVEYFPNVKVSDKLVDIIMQIINNEQPSQNDVDNLNNNEKGILDALLNISGLYKKFNIDVLNKTSHINSLKKQLKLIEGEIMAGNNNKELLIELKDVVNKLYLAKVISLQALRKYLKQYI